MEIKPLSIRCKIATPEDLDAYADLVAFCSHHNLLIEREESGGNIYVVTISPPRAIDPMQAVAMARAWDRLRQYLLIKQGGVYA